MTRSRLLSTALPLLMGFGIATTPSPAQSADPVPEWIERNPETSPSPRNGHGMVYDTARQRMVLFGGRPGDSPTFYDDTWEWDGDTWTEVSPVVSPPGRVVSAMAFDSATGRTVLFGGATAGGFVADTWEWDGATWSQVTPATSPSPRNGHGMAFDSARGRVVLFGGADVADTWEWDSDDWNQLSPPVSPRARSYTAMDYDSERGRVVLFGGATRGSFTPLDDTWEWDGSGWNQLFPEASPSARIRPSMAYDTNRGRFVLFGGVAGGSYLADTWEWDGGTAWSQIGSAANPSARGYTAIAFDAERGRTVLFGGRDATNPLGDTWEYGGAAEDPDARAVYLPLAFRNSTLTERSRPVPLPNPCEYLVAGPAASGWPSVIDLSAAHDSIRFFGVAERYSKVDQALVKAFGQAAGVSWPADEAGQLEFLEAYAGALEGVCALPAESGQLAPARVELVDGTIAVVHPGTGPVVLPNESTAVAIDLRDLPNVPELGASLEAAIAPAMARPVLRPWSSVRFHSGMTDEVFSATNIYYNAVGFSEASPITPTGHADLPLVVLTEPRLAPAAAEVAATLRLANRAVLVGDNVLSSVAESRWSSVGANGLAWRATDLFHLSATRPPSFLTNLEAHQDDCGDYRTASVKRDFTTDRSTAKVTVTLTGTIGIGPGTDLDLFVLYDRNRDGLFDAYAELLAWGTSSGSNEEAIVDEFLPAGHYQVWVNGCRVPNPPVMADVSIVVRDAYRWPDFIPADVLTDDPAASLGAAAALWLALPDIGAEPASRAMIRPVESFHDIQPIGAGPAEQRAALVVLHGAYRRFYPYFDVVGDGIDGRLVETLASVPADGQYTRKSVIYTLRRMAEVIRDGHSLFQTNGSSWPCYFLPAQLEAVGGEAVVRRAAFEGINPGDTIGSFNGRPAAEVYAEEYARTSAATDGYRFDLASRSITRLEGPTALELRSPEGMTHTVVVTDTGASGVLGPIYPRKSGWLADIDAPDLFYLNLDSAATPSIAEFRTVLTETATAAGLVLDMRGYPGVDHYEVAKRLIGNSFQSPVFRWKEFEGPDQISQFDSQGTLTPLQDPHYHGPIVLLVGPHTGSAAENFSLMLVGAHRVTVVGQRSAGTNGNITGVQLPGGIGVSFTGMEVLYPDRSVFHGVGIVPDIEAVPSAADFRDGIDRELVTAVNFLKGH